MSPPSCLLLGQGAFTNVKVHPVTLFSICDAYIRRNEKQERVIGTLLGSISDNQVEVKSCFVVPHNESTDQVMVDISHHKTMFDLHHRVSPSDIVVGWFSTGCSFSSSDALIQAFYADCAANPIHLIVDTALTNNKFTVAAYISRVLTLGDRALATEFVEVPTEVVLLDIEKVGADLLSGVTPAKSGNDSENLLASFQRLLTLIEKVSSYVDDVVSGKIEGDATIGRYLADTMSVVPRFAKLDFEALFNESIQDQMLVTYLSNVVRTQIALSEKLGTSSIPYLNP